MKISDLQRRYRVPEKIVAVLAERGYDSLYPPQEEAVRRGVLDGKNFVLAFPTAAGKTLVAELCMLKSILEKRGRCLYVAPLKALASEKCRDFREKYSNLGVTTGLATGDYDAPGNRLSRYDILIATSEKVDSLLRQRAPWLSESISVVVLDEIHYIHDGGRGPTLEIIGARLRQVNPGAQILALSATISNGRQLASWLDAELVSSDWRPVPLIEGVLSDAEIYYSDFTTRKLPGGETEPLARLVCDTLDDGGQVLVFVNSRRSSQAVARALAPVVARRLSRREKSLLEDISRAAEEALPEPTHICSELARAMRCGAAFHHAGLHAEQRRIIEDAFRNNSIKAICATPTLAAGVNLPARRVIVRDWRRYESGEGLCPIPVFEYKQFAGRAGRPGYDTVGEAILIGRKQGEGEYLFRRYVQAEIEPLVSRLGEGGALASHILSSIASGYAARRDEIMDFLSLTFYAVQRDVGSLSSDVEKILQFLLENEMINQSEDDLRATPFGATVSRLYLEPLSGIIIKRGLLAAGKCPQSERSALHLICCCPDMDLISAGKGRWQELRDEVTRAEGSLLIPSPGDEDGVGERRYLLAMHTAQMILQWIDERAEGEICENFGVGPGDIRRVLESADWLLYSMERIGKLLSVPRLSPFTTRLRQRVRYGVKNELLDLVSLKGIGRVRGRNLFGSGYRTMDDIRKATVKELGKVPSIGPALAASIKKQVI